MHGGELIAEVLRAHHVESLFTLCGGHISPILVACKKTGIRVVDTRHEATAVFAADAMARLSGIPGVAAVTAGPGVTNTVTAVKNARVAQSAVVLIGGATATVLKGRGALQDIDQISLLKSAVKWHASVKRLKQLQPILVEAFKRAQQGVPGPVFVEIPVDLLYHEPVVRNWYGNKSPGDSIAGKLQKLYLNYHVNRIFAGAGPAAVTEQSLNIPTPATPPGGRLKKVATKLKEAKNPLLLLGSQVVFHPGRAKEIAGAVRRLNIPVYLSGMSRGLLGKSHPLQMRHKRREALRKSDFIILAGVPCDFRLDYGRHIPRGAYIVSVNLNRSELFKNRRPNLAVRGHPGAFLMQLGKLFNNAGNWNEWRLCLRQWDEDREQEISEQAQSVTNGINPLYLCGEIEKFIADDAVIVADGGDFVATASYIIRPPGPLTWLDPGAFGTLGVGAGFALSAKLKNPSSEVWILYGDGAVGFSIAEFDTFVRHKIPVIAVVGNDGAWSQIAREQVDILKDDTGTVLRQTDYHRVAEGFGAKGFLLEEPGQIPQILQQARRAAGEGWPVLINALIGKTDFRKGAISM